MIYSEQTTKKALRLCYAGQKNRLTEEGMPEIFEWFAIAESMQDESAVTTALLYGAVSSGCFDMNDIKELGFPEKVIHALQILCLNETLSNDEYRERILTSPLAWKVKYAELLHKGTPGRLIQTEENSKKLEQFWNERFALEKPFSVPYCLYSDEVRAQEKVIKNRRFRDAIRGCMIGSAVGDAYGYGISKENGESCVSANMQIMLFVAVGSLYAWTRFRTTGFDATEEDYIYYALQDWAAQGTRTARNISWIIGIPELEEHRAPDIPCIDLLNRGRCGSFDKPVSDNKSASALCRVAPLVLHHKNDLQPDNVKGIMKLAANTTAMTHGHLLAILSSALLAHILSRTLYGGGIGDTLNMFLREGKQFLFELFGDSMPLHMLYEKIDLAIALASNTDCDIMNIKKIGAGLDAHDALAIATYSVLRYPLDFKAAITAAANHSGNTATTAFLTGQLLGAKLGYDRISWLAKDIEVINAIVEISDDLTDECQLHRRSDGYDDPKWRSKYIDCNYTM